MTAKQLINENNHKRKQLHEQNEKYYSGMLLYLRSHLSLSEQKTEEILMEILDHLLIAQRENRSAEEVFGTRPKEYADQLIEQLPKEERKNSVLFIVQNAFFFLGIITLFTGISSLIIQPSAPAYLGKLAITTLTGFVLLTILVKVVFAYIAYSSFIEVNKGKESAVAAAIGMAVFGIFIAVELFTPEYPPVIENGGWVIVLTGFISMSFYYVLKKVNDS
ncbi:DUF1129 family protein [Alteribacillus sp. HJP-4]